MPLGFTARMHYPCTEVWQYVRDVGRWVLVKSAFWLSRALDSFGPVARVRFGVSGLVFCPGASHTGLTRLGMVLEAPRWLCNPPNPDSDLIRLQTSPPTPHGSAWLCITALTTAGVCLTVGTKA